MQGPGDPAGRLDYGARYQPKHADGATVMDEAKLRKNRERQQGWRDRQRKFVAKRCVRCSLVSGRNSLGRGLCPSCSKVTVVPCPRGASIGEAVQRWQIDGSALKDIVAQIGMSLIDLEEAAGLGVGSLRRASTNDSIMYVKQFDALFAAIGPVCRGFLFETTPVACLHGDQLKRARLGLGVGRSSLEQLASMRPRRLDRLEAHGTRIVSPQTIIRLETALNDISAWQARDNEK